MRKFECDNCKNPSPCVHWVEDQDDLAICESYPCHRYQFVAKWHEVKQESENVFPEWIKEGEYIWLDPAYCKKECFARILVVNPTDASGCFVAGMLPEMRYTTVKQYDMKHIFPASLRPWNNEELKSKVGKVFQCRGESFLCFGYNPKHGLFFAGRGPHAYSAKELLSIQDMKLDGFPCGVLEKDDLPF